MNKKLLIKSVGISLLIMAVPAAVTAVLVSLPDIMIPIMLVACFAGLVVCNYKSFKETQDDKIFWE